MDALRVCGLALGFTVASVFSCSPAQLSEERPGGPTSEIPGNSTNPSDAAADSPSPVPTSQQPLTTNARVIIEPGAKYTELLAAINGAQNYVHMTMYILSSADVTNALIARKKAGKDVKVVLNQSFPDTTSNAAVFDQLKKAGVGVVWATSSLKFTHEKCVIIDDKQAWIMTMNLTESSPTQNREYLVVDSDADDIAQAEALFQTDYTGQAHSLAGKLLIAPVNAESSMLELMQGAQTSVDVEGESFGDDDITNALIAAKSRGLAVRVVTSTGAPTASEQQAFAALKQVGIPVVQTKSPYIHAKAIVVDGARAYLGSANFTKTSLSSNRELGLLLGAPAEVTKVANTISADFAKGTAF